MFNHETRNQLVMMMADKTSYRKTLVLVLKKGSFNDSFLRINLRNVSLGIPPSSIILAFNTTTQLKRETRESTTDLIIVLFIYQCDSYFKGIWQNLKSQILQQPLECLTLCWFKNDDWPLDNSCSLGFRPTYDILNELIADCPNLSYRNLRLFRCPGPSICTQQETILELGKGTHSVEIEFLNINNLTFMLSDASIRDVKIYTWKASPQRIIFQYPVGCEPSIFAPREQPTMETFHKRRDSFELVEYNREILGNMIIYSSQTSKRTRCSCCG